MAHEHNHNHHIHSDSEQATALLAYMIDHNKHHTEELLEISKSFSDDAVALINEAVNCFNQGNEKLEKALKFVKGE